MVCGQLKMNPKIIIALVLRATNIIVSKLTMVLVWGAFETKLQIMKIVPRAIIIVPTRDHVIFLGAFEPNEDCSSPCLIQFGLCLLFWRMSSKALCCNCIYTSWIKSMFKPVWIMSTFWRMSSQIFYCKFICECCIFVSSPCLHQFR